MRHLDDEQLIDAAEGRLESAGKAHLESCDACRTEFRRLTDVLTRVAAADVPEPSPLFWDHFRARVTAALDPAESPGATPAGLGFRWLAAAASAATLALVILAAVVPRPDAPVAGVVAVEDVDEDTAWALVSSMADDIDYDAAHDAGIAPASSAVERAALELSPAEQSALIRLLEEEMKRTDS